MTTSHQPPRVAADAAELDAYQAEAMARSSQSREPKPMAYRFFYGASSLAGEAGELFGVIKKSAFHGRPVDLEKLNDEAGDVLWYCAYLADSIGATLGECVEAGAPVDTADWLAVTEVRPEAVRNGIVLVPAAIFSRVMAVAGEILIIGSESTHDEFRRDVGRVVALVAHGLAWCGSSLTAAMAANQAKLAARYPAGYSLADYAAKEEGRAPAYPGASPPPTGGACSTSLATAAGGAAPRAYPSSLSTSTPSRAAARTTRATSPPPAATATTARGRPCR